MAIHSCTFCKQGFSVERSGSYLCPHCQQQQDVVLPAHATQEPRPAVLKPAWERRRELGWVNAVRETWPAVVLHPEDFFKSLAPKGALRDALLWGVLFGTVGFVANLVMDQMFQGLLGRFVDHSEKQLPFAGHPYFFTLFAMFFGPIFVLLGIFTQAVSMHVSLILVGARREDLDATLKTIAYAQAPLVLAVIPVLGTLGAWIWSLVLTVIGCREIHRTTTGKVVLACFLPLIVCCCIGLGISALGIAALMPVIKEFFQSLPR